MSTFSTIQSKIIAIVAADSDLDTAVVFGYEPNVEQINQDPFATVIASGNDASYASTSENKRSFNFSIRIFVERNSRGNSEAETLLTAMVDRIIQALDEDYTLTGSALTTRAANGPWGYVFATKEYRVAEILLTAIAHVDITS